MAQIADFCYTVLAHSAPIKWLLNAVLFICLFIEPLALLLTYMLVIGGYFSPKKEILVAFDYFGQIKNPVTIAITGFFVFSFQNRYLQVFGVDSNSHYINIKIDFEMQ